VLFTQLINLALLGIILFYYLSRLLKNIKKINYLHKILYLFLISFVLWGYRFLWFLPNRSMLSKYFELFDSSNFAISGFMNFFSSPADLLLSSIIFLIQLIIIFYSFFDISNINKIATHNSRLFFYIKIIIVTLAISSIYSLYFSILKTILFNSSKNLTNFFLPSIDLNNLTLQISLSLIEIGIWLLSVSILFFAVKLTKYSIIKYYDFLILASFAILLFFVIHKIFNLTISFIHYSFIFLLIFFPIVLLNTKKINNTKMALILISSLIITNYLLYLIRTNYYSELKENFLKNNVVSMIKQQEKWTYELFNSALKNIDSQLIDKQIKSVLLQSGGAYKIWSNTTFPIYGINSGIEFYDPNIILIDRFSFKTTTYPFDKIIQNELNSINFNDWKILTRQTSHDYGQDRKLLIGLKNTQAININIFIVVYVEVSYDNLPFNHIPNPYEQILLPPVKIYGEEEQYWTDLNFSIYQKENLVYTNASPPVPYLPNLVNKQWQTISINNTKYRIYYFVDNEKIFCLSYILPSSYITISAKLIELTILISIILISFLLLVNLYLLINKEKPILVPSYNSFVKKILMYFLIIAIIPFSILFYSIRNYIINEKISQGKNTAIHQLQSAINLLKDYASFTQEQYSSQKSFINDEVIKWVSNTINYDINLYKGFILESTSRRELFSSGLLNTILNGNAYFDLKLKNLPYSTSTENIGTLKYQTIYASLKLQNQTERIISLPVIIPKEALDLELAKFYEKILLSLALIFILSTILISLITKKLSEPIQSLIQATQKISKGNFKISLPKFKDYEFNSIKDSFEYMATNLDLTLDNLTQRQKYIETIITNVTNGVIAISSNGNINLINQAAIKMLHINSDKINNIYEFVSKNENLLPLQNTINKFKENITSTQSQTIEITIDNKNYYYKLSWVPLTQLFSTNDILIIIEDLTDVVSSNKLSAWAEMAKRVAHEIKNPLTPMQLAIEHLYKVFKDSPENYEQVLELCYHTITKQINILKNTINQFSLFGAEIPSKKQKIKLDNFFSSLIENYKFHLKDKIEFQLDIQNNIPDVFWDINKMQKAFTNIIENSIQAIPDKGNIKIKIYLQNSTLFIEITDDGKGIEPSFLNKIFEPYFTTKDHGTGLGLVITKKFIEEHNGTISISSSLNKGTTVKISFNLEQ